MQCTKINREEKFEKMPEETKTKKSTKATL